ncbi:MAG TPA: type IX secretion system membrane protein PorP/SprF [candidate division Zixibacteria bacterium]|nr:type IX secretion system membrane protein PorP/SprF [candidate division Zixibacteria bacterium]
MQTVRTFLILALILVAFTALYARDIEDNLGARPLGMGRAFVSIADDGNAALWNPAGMSFYNERILTGMFSRLYWGIDNDAIGEGQLGYIHHFRKGGDIGINAVMLFSNIWQETRLTMSYSHNIGNKFSLGVNARLLRNEVVQNNITFTPGSPAPPGMSIVDPRDDPFFSDGWDKIGFTGDVGIMFRPDRNLAIGVMAANLNQPDMSFKGVGEHGQIPMTIRAGASYWIQDDILPSMDVQYIMSEVNGGNQIHHYNGIEWWFPGKTMALRGGYNASLGGEGYDPTEASFGFTYRNKKALDVQVDYAFVYPLSELRQTGATSHKISASLRFLPPPERLYDLALRSPNMSVYPRDAQIGEVVTVRALVENLGERPVRSYWVSFYYEHPEQGWINAAPAIRVDDRLDVGETKEVEFKWTPRERGHYQLFCSVDDDGSILPALRNFIDEIDEENNTGVVVVDVFGLPKGTVSPIENTLEISQVTLVREEEPVVPIFFFAPGADRVNERFHYLQSILGARLRENPDIDIDIYGFYDPESDGVTMALGDRLSENRAKAVRSVFMRFEQIAADRIHVMDPLTYNTSRPRAGLPIEHLPEDVPLSMAENRRVQMVTRVKGFEDWSPTIYFDSGSDRVEVGNLSEVRRRANDIREIMERNPEIILLMEGYVSSNEVTSRNQWVQLSFDRANNVKQLLGEILGSDFVRRHDRRLFIRGNTDEYADRGKVDILLDGEGLIYRPLEGTMAAKGYELNQEQVNFVHITSDVEAGVDTFTVSIVDSEGRTFRVLATGSGNIPAGAPWDWKDHDGNLISPTEEYFCKLEIRDRLGQTFTTLSDPIAVRVTQRQQQMETLVIVEFTFDEKISESAFLESRVEYVARRFIEKALEPKLSLTAVVAGHTDIIGMDHRNRELSIERARKEEENLRRYLIYLLGLADNAELNAWLRTHNTTLTYRGYSDTQPYIITKWVDNTLVEEKIGENELPEGRTVNRRVVIDFIMEKEGVPEEEVEPQSMAD